MKNDYQAALDRGRQENKLVLVTFTGYACTNCHWMKANMFTKPEIASALKNFVLVELYTDGTDAESEANQKVQLDKFKTVAIPFYAIVDPDEKTIATYPGATSNAPEYLAFLNTAPVPAAAPVEASAAPPASGGSSFPKASKISGEPFDTTPLSGKVTVINFWATWCVPCISEIPSFNKLHKELSGKGVAVLGIAMDEEGTTRVPLFLKKHPMDYPVALGADALNTEYNLDSLPVTVIFDRTGKQVKRFEGLTTESALLAAIRQAL
jgi:thiol:disulfide interchange protein DsbD